MNRDGIFDRPSGRTLSSLLLFPLMLVSLQPTEQAAPLLVDPKISPSNSSLLQYDFTDQLYSLTAVGDQFYVGGTNRVYQIKLTNSSTVSSVTDDDGRYLTFSKPLSPTPAAIDDGPYRGCNPSKAVEPNRIRHLFVHSGLLFACGTARCGQCSVMRLDFNISKPVGNYELPVNMVASNYSSLLFLANHHHQFLYSGFSPDGQTIHDQVPFLSLRAISLNRRERSFRYAQDNGSERSVLRINSTNSYRFHFLTGFTHNGATYMLFLEHNLDSPKPPSLRLSRVCENDFTFFSYMETAVVCGNRLTNATAAHLSIWTGSSPQQQNSLAVLLVAFADGHNSAVCSFSMDQIENHFYEGFKDCNTVQHYTRKLFKIFGEDLPCKEVGGSTPSSQQCLNSLSISNNRYIDIKRILNGTPIVQFNGSQVTSVGSVFAETGNHRVHYLFAGTRSPPRLYKFFSVPGKNFQQHYVLTLRQPLLMQQNLTFDLATGSFFLLTQTSLLRFPILDYCSIFATCSSCFRSKLFGPPSHGRCVWIAESKRCQLDSTSSATRHECPPVVTRFEPNSGPMQGGTEVTFYGENFGLNRNNIKNSDVQITFDHDIPCYLIERFDHYVRCRLGPVPESKRKPTDNVSIQFKVHDWLDVANRHFVINGTVNMEYRFTEPKVKGVHPNFGPFIGGTKILINGQHLDTGSNVTVTLNNATCRLLSRSQNYIACETPPSKDKDMAPIHIQIDQYQGRLDDAFGSFTLKPEDIFLNYQYRHRKRSLLRRYRHEDKQNCIKWPRYQNLTVERLFWFRFQRSYESTPSFHQRFSYRPDPSVRDVKHPVGLYRGSTMIQFSGDHLDSVRYPELELTFRNLSVLCECQMQDQDLQCEVPSLERLSMESSSDLISAKFQLHLDGYVNKSELDSGQIRYVTSPKFGQPRIISTADRNFSLILSGHHLDPELPYRVTIKDEEGGEYPCRGPNFLPDQLQCKILIPHTEKIIGQTLNVTVVIGLMEPIIIGQVQAEVASIPLIKGSNSVVVWLIGVMLALLLISLIGLYLLWAYVKKNISKEYDRIDSQELAEMTNRLENFFRQAFPGSEKGKLLFDELKRENKILCDVYRLKLLVELGSGEYGVVYSAKLNDTNLAVKICKDSNGTSLLMEELEVMKDFDHENVISLKYVTLLANSMVPNQYNLALVMPYMDHGDLRNYVKDPANQPTLACILDFCLQIARGMDYLSKKNFVHRDLAARNCLLDAQGCVKISDFGLARFYADNKQYYKLRTEENRLPIKWMALESLKSNKFTTKSDVWSYGVLVWELFTRGKDPYPGQKNIDELVDYLESGHRLSRPSYMAEGKLEILWAMVLQCWIVDPDERPEFHQLVYEINQINQMFATGLEKRKTEVLERQQQMLQRQQTFDFCAPDIRTQLESHYKRQKNHAMQHFGHERPLLADGSDAEQNGRTAAGSLSPFGMPSPGPSPQPQSQLMKSYDLDMMMVADDRDSWLLDGEQPPSYPEATTFPAYPAMAPPIPDSEQYDYDQPRLGMMANDRHSSAPPQVTNRRRPMVNGGGHHLNQMMES